VVPRDEGAKIISSCSLESLESGARGKRGNTARGNPRLCSFSFSGRITGQLQKKEERLEPSFVGFRSLVERLAVRARCGRAAGRHQARMDQEVIFAVFAFLP
jgi:hypothetical protein